MLSLAGSFPISHRSKVHRPAECRPRGKPESRRNSGSSEIELPVGPPAREVAPIATRVVHGEKAVARAAAEVVAA